MISEPITVHAYTQEKSGQTRKRKNTGKNTKKTTSKAQTKSTGKGATAPKTSAEAKKRQEAAQKEIKLTEAQIKENEAKVSQSLTELGKLDLQIDQTKGKIKELDTKIGKLRGEIGSLESGISKNEEELSRLRDEYLKAVKKMRVTKKNKSTLAFIFSSGSVSQAMRRMRYLREFSSWRGRQTEEINGKIADLKRQKEALAQARTEQENALALQKSSEAQLKVQHGRQEALVAELKQNGQALQSHLKKKQAEANELGSMVSQLIAEEQRKAREEAQRQAEEEARRKAEEEKRRQEMEKLTSSKEEPQLASAQEKKEKKKKENKKEEKGNKPTEYADARKRAPRGKNENTNVASNTNADIGFPGMRGKLPAPTTGSFTVTSRFGRQHLPDLPDVEYDNPGIDAETEAGASARAVYDGKVSGVYLLPGYNTVVIVNHGNYYTVYGNISQATVKNGDTVTAGKNLGTLALNDEDSRHASIHFEVWRNREKLNPQDWLR